MERLLPLCQDDLALEAAFTYPAPAPRALQLADTCLGHSMRIRESPYKGDTTGYFINTSTSPDVSMTTTPPLAPVAISERSRDPRHQPQMQIQRPIEFWLSVIISYCDSGSQKANGHAVWCVCACPLRLH
jgi:hypothetical protein